MNYFNLSWLIVHIVGLSLLLMAKCFSIGFSIGLSAPIDIHIPTNEDIEHMIEEYAYKSLESQLDEIIYSPSNENTETDCDEE